jgi:hypothetical protein
MDFFILKNNKVPVLLLFLFYTKVIRGVNE